MMSIAKMTIVLSIFLPFWVSAQISVQLFLNENYLQRDTITKLMYYNLSKNGIAYRSKPVWDGNEVIVPDTGVYILNSSFYAMLPREYRVVVGKNPILDTLVYPDVIQPRILSGEEEFLQFCCSDKKCEGYQVEYYPNGSKRIDGVFKNGLALGDVTVYRLNGKPLTIIKFKKPGIFKKRILCDKNGKRRGTQKEIRPLLVNKMPNIN
jgi:hypothetical protein